MPKRLYILILLFLIVNCSYSQVDAGFTVDSQIVCSGAPVSFIDQSQGDSINNFHWYFGDGNQSFDKNPQHIYTDTGIYTVSLTIENTIGFTDSLAKQKYIIVRQKPNADFYFSLSKQNFNGDTLSVSSYYYSFTNNTVLNDSLGCIYSWKFENTVLADTSEYIDYLFNSSGDQTVSLIVNAGKMCTDTLDTTITVEDDVRVPNIFTPNDDGHNDFFVVRTDGYNIYEMYIFDRWGAVVHYSKSKKLIWDGFNTTGVKLDSGTYFYVITSDTKPGFEKTGFLHLRK